MRLGESIKHYRLENGWTLKTLSEQCDLSVAQLSKLENDKSKPSIDALRRLASVFNVPISALTLTETPPSISPVLNGEGFIVRWCSKGVDSVTVRYLTLNRNAKMQPIVVSIPEGMDTGVSKSHPGDEYFYVLTGNVRFHYGDNDVFDMKIGDFLYYDGYVPHHWENIGKGEAQLLTCNTPPVM
jgi:transcriptional regulator with XRE-family HTH domain